MKSRHILVLLATVLAFAATASAQLEPPKLAVPYGENPVAGATVEVNGIKLHYETYGQGTPLLMIHGNGGSIAHLGYQIEAFAPRYQVIVADSRGHGQSEMGPGRLTYEHQAEDLNALLDHLHLKSAYVLGWSDGGILGLLLAIHHPDKVAKLAIMGANLRPDGAYAWARDRRYMLCNAGPTAFEAGMQPFLPSRHMGGRVGLCDGHHRGPHEWKEAWPA